jgi:hypothetical protein
MHRQRDFLLFVLLATTTAALVRTTTPSERPASWWMVVIARAAGFLKQQFHESICMVRSNIGVRERVAEGAAIGGC